MLEKYRPLSLRVTSRAELNDLLGQMVSELSALHTFVHGGDRRKGDADIDVASLGAVLVRDDKGGGYRVDRIYRSDPDLPGEAPPLAAPGAGIKTGDVHRIDQRRSRALRARCRPAGCATRPSIRCCCTCTTARPAPGAT